MGLLPESWEDEEKKLGNKNKEKLREGGTLLNLSN